MTELDLTPIKDRLARARHLPIFLTEGDIAKARENRKGLYRWHLEGTWDDAVLFGRARDDIAALLAEVERLREHSDIPDPCNMTHTPPFDFGGCETHDRSFPLGDTCPFDGATSIAAVYEEEARKQRIRAVQAEMQLDQLRGALNIFRARLDAVKEIGSEHWNAQIKRESKFGRTGSSCVCEVCKIMRALDSGEQG